MKSSSSHLTLIVLAAGIGSRYGGLKQVDPVGPGGELIVDYSVYDALRAGFRRVVFVINEQIEDLFRQRVGRNIERQCETVYVRQRLEDVPPGLQVPANALFQRHKPWGTAHATLACRDVVQGNVAVINADDFYGQTSYEALYDYLVQARDQAGVYEFCMIGFRLLNTLTEHGSVARGVCAVDEDGFLREIHERTRIEQCRQQVTSLHSPEGDCFGPNDGPRNDAGGQGEIVSPQTTAARNDAEGQTATAGYDAGELARYTEDGVTWIDIPPEAVASLNMWGFTPALFPELAARFPRFLRENTANLQRAEFFLPEVVGNLIREGKARVKVLPTQERWFGVTYQQDRPRVKQAIRELIERGVYPEKLWEDGR